MKRKPREWYELRHPKSYFYTRFLTAKGAQGARTLNEASKGQRIYFVREVLPPRGRK